MTAVVHRTRAHHTAAPRTRDRRDAARPAAVRPPRAAAERTRRWWAGAVVAASLSVAGLGLHGVLSGPGDVPASAAGAGPAPAEGAVKAHAGDSLWSIAERFRGAVPIQRYVDALVELNGGSTRIDAGQLVLLP
jgi:nucleoid-associated protein YgaU